MNSTIVLIPAYNPDVSLLNLIVEVRDCGVTSAIIIVNDGSRKECKKIFEQCLKNKDVEIIEENVNRGKGAALKTGFKYILDKYKDVKGIVTADADGQHLAIDIKRVLESFLISNDRLIMGTRTFDKGVPFRSRFGNIATREILKLVTGLNLSDTQTGLRGIPVSMCEDSLCIKDEGYSFELQFIILMINKYKMNSTMIEVNIETVYEPGNPKSHFNPLLDSIKIYSVFLRHIISSITKSISK